jgi:hypothetical protein
MGREQTHRTMHKEKLDCLMHTYLTKNSTSLLKNNFGDKFLPGPLEAGLI